MGQTRRVAIAGCHRMLDRKPANHNFATAFDAVPDTEIVAVFDLGTDTRQAFSDCWGDHVSAYDHFDSMLQQEKPDILCLATSQKMHADQIQQAVAVRCAAESSATNPSPPACPKPIACSTPAVPPASLSPLGLDRRWLVSYRRLAAAPSRRHHVGQLQSMIIYGIPNLINHGCHWYDVALYLAGDLEPQWVSGFVEDVSAEPADSRRRLDPTGRCIGRPAGWRPPLFHARRQPASRLRRHRRAGPPDDHG